MVQLILLFFPLSLLANLPPVEKVKSKQDWKTQHQQFLNKMNRELYQIDESVIANETSDKEAQEDLQASAEPTKIIDRKKASPIEIKKKRTRVESAPVVIDLEKKYFDY